MLKKWLNKILPERGQKDAMPAPRVLPFAQHGLSAADLSAAAEQVVSRLQQAGFAAYVVGGAVRDLLLGMVPKDFDVATDATPEQVRRVFRRSRIIGRRFKIVHVMVGAETIEVTTFRGGAGQVRQNEYGRIMQDNHYGRIDEDAMRRDFTCNALYFNPKTGEILDFATGFDDIRARRLVMIGQAAARYQEDPVRLLRAARLSAKLGFQVAEETAAPMAAAWPLLQKEPDARLFDEVLKLLFSGAAVACVQRLRQLGLRTDASHPLLDRLLHDVPERDAPDNVVSLALAGTDARMAQDLPVSAGFVLAAVLWPQLAQRWQATLPHAPNADAALAQAMAWLRDEVQGMKGLPQRQVGVVREIWMLQARFAAMRGARPFRLLNHPRFRAAYDFMLLRARAGEVPQHMADWWTAFQAASESERQEMVQAASAVQPQTNDPAKRKKRPRKRKKPTGETA